jgi:rubrerythrin
MNHIEIYEKMYSEATDYEVKGLIKQFYSMEIDKANQAIHLLKLLIDSKTNYYMNR